MLTENFLSVRQRFSSMKSWGPVSELQGLVSSRGAWHPSKPSGVVSMSNDFRVVVGLGSSGWDGPGGNAVEAPRSRNWACVAAPEHTVSPLGHPVWGLAGSALLLALLHLPGGPGTQGENLPTLWNLYSPFTQRNCYLIEQENFSFLTSPHPPLKSLLVERLFLSFHWSSMKVNGFPLLCLLLSFLHTYSLMKTLTGLKLPSQLGHVRQVREVNLCPPHPAWS